MVKQLDDGGWLGAAGKKFGSWQEATQSFGDAFHWPKPNLRPERLARTQHLRVFLCHGKEDKATVRDLHRKLTDVKTQPWLDEINLLPGQEWKVEIAKAISDTDAFLACISTKGMTREGFLHREIREAVDRAMNMPAGRIFLIPIRLDRCDVPRDLRHLQWVDYFDTTGFDYLVRALAGLAEYMNSAGASIHVPG
jgi:hypothetical protein